MKKLLAGIMTATIVFSIYVVWLKSSSTCVSCGIVSYGLPISQLTIAILALVGSSVIAISYLISQKAQSFTYVSLGFSGVLAIIASFLAAVQTRHSICWPCFTTDILFYLIFILIFLEVINSYPRKIDLGGIRND